MANGARRTGIAFTLNHLAYGGTTMIDPYDMAPDENAIPKPSNRYYTQTILPIDANPIDAKDGRPTTPRNDPFNILSPTAYC